MTNLTQLTKDLNKLNQEVTNLKIELEIKEVMEYTKYKEENPKDRTAMDKVLAVLKLEDEEWQEKESQYEQLKLEYEKLKLINQVVQKLLSRDDINLEQIGEFIKNTLD